MNFRDLAELCEKLEGTRRRTQAVELVSDFLKRLQPEEVEPAVCMILGRPFPKGSGEKLEVSWMTLRDLILRITGIGPEKMAVAFERTGDLGATVFVLFESRRTKRQSLFVKRPLELLEVQCVMKELAAIKGPRARQRKERLLEGILNRSDPLEVKYLVKTMVGEMRTGFQEGLMELAVGRAFGFSTKLIQRASMFMGDVTHVARLTAERDRERLEALKPVPLTPIKPMLAQVARDVKQAIESHKGRTALECKLDGARIQIHKRGHRIRIFSRRLSDVTKSLPEVAELVSRELKAEEAIVEGEAIAVNKDGYPLPFQSLLQRFRREREVERMVHLVPVKLQLFDVLCLNGESLVDAPYEQRRKRLKEVSGAIGITEQLVTSDPAEGEDFLARALRAGHEGLMAKELGSPYAMGMRGKRWLKIKPVLEPLDLVIVGAEFGYGRKHEWLSDYYLAARDERKGKFEIVGKTFKGLTDEEIRQMTRRLEELALRRERRRVWIFPKIVVEVSYNEIQQSPKYPCGMALRFARITRIRDDKSAEEADSIDRVRAIYAKQVKRHR